MIADRDSPPSRCVRFGTRNGPTSFTLELSTPSHKNISLKPSGKSALLFRPSHPTRGAARDRHETRGGMRWTWMLRLTSAAEADGEVVWSRRPDAGVKSCGKTREAMVARKPGRQGEHDISCKPLRREGRIASAEPVCSCAYSFVQLHTRPRVQRASGLPCALLFLGRNEIAKLGRNVPREGEGASACLSIVL